MFYLSLVKRVFVILSLLSLLFIDVYSTTPVNVVKKEVKFQKVQEKIYEEFIRAIVFSSVIKDGREQIYPKVIVLEKKELQFLDENGNVVSRKPLVDWEYIETGKFHTRRAILSKRGNFIGIHDYIAKPTDPIPTIVEEKYIIYNDAGDEIYRIKGPVEGAGQGDWLLISDKDGSVTRFKIEYGTIDMYSPDGTLKTVRIFDEVRWGLREGYVTFSDDGGYIAALVREAAEPIGGMPSLKADVWVMLFDRSGNELWRRKVDENKVDLYQPEKIVISEHGEYLIFEAFTIQGETAPKKGEHRDLSSVTLYLYDKEGNGLSFSDTSLFIFSRFCFSPKEDYVGIGGGNLIRLISTNDGSIVFEKELPVDVSIRDLLFSSDGEHLIARVEVPIGKEKIPEWTEGPRDYSTIFTNRVFMFDMKGQKIWQNDFHELQEIFSEKGFLVLLYPHKYEISEKN